MSEFLKVKTAQEVLEIIEGFCCLESETVPLQQCCGRILDRSVPVPEPVPHFNRATMDGYAVRAQDTFGAAESLPALLEVSAEVRMGQSTELSISPGQAVAIPTGGMLPAGADAVVMVEYTQVLGDGAIEVIKPVAPGDNVLQIGEDLPQGKALFGPGWKLRPQDAGALAALGVERLSVHRRPRVAILSTGDEIVAPQTRDLPVGKIRDINSSVIAAQVAGASAQVGRVAVLADHLETLTEACGEALAEHDVVLLSGGSSVGVRDYTLRIIERLPGAELLVHGVAIRPGKPTLLARVENKIFCGLPGQPTSAMIVFTAFVQPLLARLQGHSNGSGPVQATRRAVLDRRLPSVHGRADYCRVALRFEHGRHLATPVFGKSAMISTLMHADGYVVVPEHVEGYDRGTEVTVVLFDDA